MLELVFRHYLDHKFNIRNLVNLERNFLPGEIAPHSLAAIKWAGHFHVIPAFSDSGVSREVFEAGIFFLTGPTEHVYVVGLFR